MLRSLPRPLPSALVCARLSACTLTAKADNGAPMGPVRSSMIIGKGGFNALVEVLQRSIGAKGIPLSAQSGMRALGFAPVYRRTRFVKAEAGSGQADHPVAT